jgi:hypothetical protein
MSSTEQQGSTKKPYRKPTVTEVHLAPDEAVLAHCKGTSVGGQYTNVCQGTVWGYTYRCSDIGS